jgi:1-phosphatidylinositol-3-phosphate 5-kinase
MRGRYVESKKFTKGDVLMDENFLEYIYHSPVYVMAHSKGVLMDAILSDTQFLAKNSIMDYSLLIGLDEEKMELIVGIIDFVRPFTFDKLLEMYIKKAGRSVLPTVVYPEMYRKRFVEAMDRYFTPVPDKWTGLGTDVKINS